MIQTIRPLLVILFFIAGCTSSDYGTPLIGDTHNTLKIATWNIYWLTDNSYNIRSDSQIAK